MVVRPLAIALLILLGGCTQPSSLQDGAEDGPNPETDVTPAEPAAGLPQESWPPPVVKSCKLRIEASTSPVLGHWLNAACGFGGRTPDAVQPAPEGRYGAAGFTSFETFRSGVVEATWTTDVPAGTAFNLRVQTEGSRTTTLANSTQQTAGVLRVTLDETALSKVDDQTFAWVGVEGAAVDVDIEVRVSLSQTPRLADDYSAF